MKGIRFWLWGLSAWLIPPQLRNTTPTYTATLTTPKYKEEQNFWWMLTKVRLPMLLVGWIFLIAAPVIVAAEFLIERLFGAKLPAGLTTIVNYVSAVKLYSQPRRHGPGQLEAAIEPPRYTIRRRMVETIADVAAADYDRWYILAHSQGTVVAFNGLMASSPAVTAYLDDDRLDKLHTRNMAGPRRGEQDGPPVENLLGDRRFRPTIPPERYSQTEEDYRVVYRDRLFADMKGFITYGSPLDKFAAIWPPTVSINRDIHAFPEDAQWINVYDPTDPVGANLDAFDKETVFDRSEEERCPIETPGRQNTLQPVNIAYKAGPVLLASHVQYLASTGKKSFSQGIAQWLLNGRIDASDVSQITQDELKGRKRLAFIQVLFIGFVLFLIADYILVSMFGGVSSVLFSLLPFLEDYPWISSSMSLVISVAIVGLISAIGYMTTEIDIDVNETYTPKTLFQVKMASLNRKSQIDQNQQGIA